MYLVDMYIQVDDGDQHMLLYQRMYQRHKLVYIFCLICHKLHDQHSLHCIGKCQRYKRLEDYPVYHQDIGI